MPSMNTSLIVGLSEAWVSSVVTTVSFIATGASSTLLIVIVTRTVADTETPSVTR